MEKSLRERFDDATQTLQELYNTQPVDSPLLELIDVANNIMWRLRAYCPK